jgi:hypothetical protein
MIPCSLWDEDPRFLDTFTADAREEIRTRFGVSNFSSSTKYVCVLCRYEEQSKLMSTFTATRVFQTNGPIRATEVVEALTAATRPEDLVEAFVWFENVLRSQHAHKLCSFFGTEPPQCMAALRRRARYPSFLEPLTPRSRT